jgi:hypothetical protein
MFASRRLVSAAIPAGLFLGISLVLLSVQRGSTPTYDASIYIQVTRSIVDHRSLTVTNDPYGINTPYAYYGLGLSIVLIPFYLMQKLFDADSASVLVQANVLFTAATALILYRIGILLRWSTDTAATGAVVFGVLTMAVQQSTDLFSEPGLCFFLMLAVFGVLASDRPTTIGPWCVGLGCAGAIFFRFDSVLLCAIPLVAFHVHGELRRGTLWTRARLLALCLPLAAAFVYQAWYNKVRFGSVFNLGYKGQGFSTPFLEGFGGNLLSPGKGFFVFNPIMLLALPGLLLMWSRQRRLFAIVVVISLARPIFYATWSSWGAGVGWGPRFMLPLAAILTIPVMQFTEWISRNHRRRRWGIPLLGGMSVVAAGVVVLSVVVPFEQWWKEISAPEQGAAIVAKRQHDYYWTFSGNNIVGNLRLMDRVDPNPLKWFEAPFAPFGPLLLATGLGVLTAVAFAARNRTRTGMVEAVGNAELLIELETSVLESGTEPTETGNPGVLDSSDCEPTTA